MVPSLTLHVYTQPSFAFALCPLPLGAWTQPSSLTNGVSAQAELDEANAEHDRVTGECMRLKDLNGTLNLQKKTLKAQKRELEKQLREGGAHRASGD